MEFQATPKQVLVMWNLLFTGAEPMISKVQPALTPKERQGLAQAGLIRLEQRGRAKHVVLEDAAWDWAAENLGAEISQSKFAAPILQAVLSTLQDRIHDKSLSLAEFVGGEGFGGERDAADLVFEAYMSHTGGHSNVRVRLSELRRSLPQFDRAELDELLLAMQREGRYALTLWSLDDPRDIGPEDEAAAVNVAGMLRHIVYMEA